MEDQYLSRNDMNPCNNKIASMLITSNYVTKFITIIAGVGVENPTLTGDSENYRFAVKKQKA